MGRTHVTIGVAYIALVLILAKGWAGNIANAVRTFAGVSPRNAEKKDG